MTIAYLLRISKFKSLTMYSQHLKVIGQALQPNVGSFEDLCLSQVLT